MMTEFSRWRSAAEDPDDDLASPSDAMESAPVSYYPGGERGGVVPQEAHIIVEAEPEMNKGPIIQATGVFLLLLGICSVIIAYSANDSLSVRALFFIVALVMSGTGAHLLVNGVSASADKDDSDTKNNVSLIAMALGATLGIVLLNSASGALQWYGGIMSFCLFVYGYVSLLAPRK